MFTPKTAVLVSNKPEPGAGINTNLTREPKHKLDCKHLHHFFCFKDNVNLQRTLDVPAMFGSMNNVRVRHLCEMRKDQLVPGEQVDFLGSTEAAGLIDDLKGPVCRRGGVIHKRGLTHSLLQTIDEKISVTPG